MQIANTTKSQNHQSYSRHTSNFQLCFVHFFTHQFYSHWSVEISPEFSQILTALVVLEYASALHTIMLLAFCPGVRTYSTLVMHNAKCICLCLYICLSAFLSVCPPHCLSVCQSVCLSACLCLCLSFVFWYFFLYFCLSVWISFYLSIFQYKRFSIKDHLCTYPVCPTVYLSACMSLCLSAFVSFCSLSLSVVVCLFERLKLCECPIMNEVYSLAPHPETLTFNLWRFLE